MSGISAALNKISAFATRDGCIDKKSRLIAAALPAIASSDGRGLPENATDQQIVLAANTSSTTAKCISVILVAEPNPATLG